MLRYCGSGSRLKLGTSQDTRPCFLASIHPDYPRRLAELPDPPERLFVRGHPLSQLSPRCVAIVGSRRATSFGQAWARKLGMILTRHGVSVCSGLAVGIDAAAHWGAIEEQDRGRGGAVPVAVLGHGWNFSYPKANLGLRDRLERQGIVVTEFAPDHPPSHWTFPKRNRIIAGLCQCVVVVEAGAKSGALHTARSANEAGRDVWVVPQRPGSPNSAGILGLLRDGAIPMIDIEEFVQVLLDGLKITCPPDPISIPPHLLPLVYVLKEAGPLAPGDLLGPLGCQLPGVMCLLAELEMMGLAERNWDGSWVLMPTMALMKNES